MFDTPIDDLDADETLTLAAELRAASERAEARLLEVAAHFGDLHGVVDGDCGRSVLSGMEKLVVLGGEGTPKVAEFAPAELGAELGMSAFAASMLIGDALDLRHRLPILWARIRSGDVKPWIGRKIAAATRCLHLTAAGVVDASVAPWADRLTWSRLERVVEAAVIDADPAQAYHDNDERRRLLHGVWVNPTDNPDTATAFIRGDAVDLRFFDASLDRTADGLALLGDTDCKDVRRARAVGILANPQQTLDLYADVAEAVRARDPGDLPDEITSSDGLGGADTHGADDPGGDNDTLPAPPADSGHGCGCAGWRPVDPRPPATLYVHLGWEAFVRDSDGVARVEGIGPVTIGQAKRWLGHCQVTVKPVLDLPGMAPVDCYEIPNRFREAVTLTTPADVFPYASNTTRSMDIDHSKAYVSPDDGGPPGQTRIGNLGPMTRRHHRIKTHGRWQLKQPYPGIYLWRSPHNRYYLVDHTGTRALAQPA